MDNESVSPRLSPLLTLVGLASLGLFLASELLDSPVLDSSRSLTAGVMALMLARHLGLRSGGAVFAAVSFGFSAYVLTGEVTERGATVASLPALERPWDMVSCGLTLALIGVLIQLRSRAKAAVLAPLPAALAGGLACFVCASLLLRRGLPPTAALAIVPDLYGLPQLEGGYLGPGVFGREVAGWIAPLAACLGLAALWNWEGRLRRRGSIALTGGIAACFVWRLPGFAELWPLELGLGQDPPAWLGGWSALAFSLLAGEGLESAPRAARAGACLLVGASMLALALRPAPAVVSEELARAAADEASELFVIERAPERALDGSPVWVAARVSTALNASGATLRIESVNREGGGEGSRGSWSIHVEPRAMEPDAIGADPAFRSFSSPGPIDLRGLPNGHYKFSLEIFREDAGSARETLGSRSLALSSLARRPRLSGASLWLLILNLAALGLRPSRRGLVVALACGLSLAWLIAL